MFICTLDFLIKPATFIYFLRMANTASEKIKKGIYTHISVAHNHCYICGHSLSSDDGTTCECDIQIESDDNNNIFMHASDNNNNDNKLFICNWDHCAINVNEYRIPMPLEICPHATHVRSIVPFGCFCSFECMFSYNNKFLNGQYVCAIKQLRFILLGIPTSYPLAEAPPPCILDKYVGGTCDIASYRKMYTFVHDKMIKSGLKLLTWKFTASPKPIVVASCAAFNVGDELYKKSLENNCNGNQNFMTSTETSASLSVIPALLQPTTSVSTNSHKVRKVNKLVHKHCSDKNKLPCVTPIVTELSYDLMKTADMATLNAAPSPETIDSYENYIKRMVKGNTKHARDDKQLILNDNNVALSKYIPSPMEGLTTVPVIKSKRIRRSIVLPVHATSNKTFDTSLPRTPSATEQSVLRFQESATGSYLSPDILRAQKKGKTEYMVTKQRKKQKLYADAI